MKMFQNNFLDTKFFPWIKLIFSNSITYTITNNTIILYEWSYAYADLNPIKSIDYIKWTVMYTSSLDNYEFSVEFGCSTRSSGKREANRVRDYIEEKHKRGVAWVTNFDGTWLAY